MWVGSLAKDGLYLKANVNTSHIKTERIDKIPIK